MAVKGAGKLTGESRNWLRLLALTVGALLCLMASMVLFPANGFAVELDVTATTRVQVEVEPRGLRPIIRARLVDNVNTGVADKALRIDLIEQDKPVEVRHVVSLVEQTDALGYATSEVRLKPGSYMAYVAFDGEPFLDASKAEKKFEARRGEITVQFDAPRTLHQEEGVALEMTVSATLPFLISKNLRAQPTAKNQPTPTAKNAAVMLETKMGPLFSTIELGSAIRERIGGNYQVFGRDTVDGPSLPTGRNELRLRYPEDDYYSALDETREVFVFRDPHLSFDATIHRDRSERGVDVHGELTSAQGPIPGGRIVVYVSQEHTDWEPIGELTTDGEGAFGGFLEQAKFPTGKVALRLSFEPDAGRRLLTQSVALEMDRGGAAIWAVWLLAFLGGLAIAIGGAYLLFDRIRSWTRRRLHKRPPPALEAEPLRKASGPPRAVVGSSGIGGFVYDEDDSVFVQGIEVRVGNRITHTDADGWFAFDSVDTGKQEVRFSGYGYLTRSVEIAIPHDGVWANAHIAVVPVRARVRQLYVWLLEAHAPGKDLWGKTTPQEFRDELLQRLEQGLSLEEPAHNDALLHILEEARGHDGFGQRLAIATKVIEAVYYSPRIFSEELSVELARVLDSLGGALAEAREKRRVAFVLELEPTVGVTQ